MSNPWRLDPGLAGRFHQECPDDLQVAVHDGEPRRTRRIPEGCWVRVTGVRSSLRFPIMAREARPPIDPASAQWIERTVYRGTLLNQPNELTGTRKGDEVLFILTPGVPHPLQVSEAYLDERTRWAFAPCDKCGADHALDPPSVMARTRFPDAPAGSTPIAFTAFCVCGGTMMLAAIEGARSGGDKAAVKKAWWKFW